MPRVQCMGLVYRGKEVVTLCTALVMHAGLSQHSFFTRVGERTLNVLCISLAGVGLSGGKSEVWLSTSLIQEPKSKIVLRHACPCNAQLLRTVENWWRCVGIC